ncbi:MAG: tRNA uridine(34) 5-carboxymethylaminomethyl modification radical SAM/GNAT enzyme Elp3 [Caldilineaceae bacterium]|nr:tRNA uridine(34) 5-carboxymethylaminomethyl modification radical SAM/GNAT enzyme Elp3 [Caldilineaceae bacterium]
MKRIIPLEEIPDDVLEKGRLWQESRNNFDPAAHSAHMTAIFQRILAVPDAEWRPKEGLRSILARFPKDGKGLYSKANLIAGYRHLIDEGDLDPDPTIMARIRMKPMRTASGVAPVTVLTAPAGCPAQCIFCPDDYRMPKSYIFDEPGCQRAERDGFDPFRQTLGRIEAFESIGHDASKVELLILGGTWSAYSRDYREWFVRRCFDAMNAAGNKDYVESTTLEEAQAINVTAAHRNVGLVIETRPDWVNPEEIRHLRKLGVTKVQIGVQSLDDEILEMNKRGHKVAEVRHALGLLRTAGFKLHLHWMPNLYGATAESDHADFARFFSDPAIRPDELKIYPCSLIAGTELFDLWTDGEYHPYTEAELVALLADVKPTIPPYTRVNRLFRDIPAHHIRAGVTASNLREVVHAELARRGTRCGCIRCREIKRTQVREEDLTLRTHTYETDLTTELFLSFETRETGDKETRRQGDKESYPLPNPQSPIPNPQSPPSIAAFLRLSFPKSVDAGSRAFLEEIRDTAMIREVHVYGPALAIGADKPGAPQHVGLGSRLILEAKRLSRAAGFDAISVIAATGTQGYYAERGFERVGLYMVDRGLGIGE